MTSVNDSGGVVLAVDQGTTGTKAMLVDAALRVLGEGSRELEQHFPQPGWVEHDLEQIFVSVRGAVRDALRAARLEPANIAAIGLANQRETTALWDPESGEPVHRAIVWQDRRTSEHCADLKRKGLEPAIRQRTGLLVDPYFSGTKIAWLLDNVRGARALAEAGKLLFGTIDTYLAWRLTGGASHVTDVTNACRTLLMDLETCQWCDEILEMLQIPAAILPRICANDEILGVTRRLDFLPDGIPLGALAGDQQSALFGQACFEPGEAKCTYGTGAFVVLNTGDRIVRSKCGMLSTAAWRLKGQTCYALEGSCFIAGAVVQWLRDGLGILESSERVEELARSVDSSEGVVLVPSLTGLGAPHWDPKARGLIAGITRGTTKAHVARAALEGIAFQIHDVIRAMEQDLGRRIRELKVDGGAARNNLLMQFQADLLATETVRPRITATTALGVALQAGMTVDLFPSLATIQKSWKEELRFKPRMKKREIAEHLKRWEAAIRQVRL